MKKGMILWFAVCVGAVCLVHTMAPPAPAQEHGIPAVEKAADIAPSGTAAPAPSSVGAERTESMTVSIGEILRISGRLVYGLIALSLIALSLAIYFLFVLREEQVVPRALRRELALKIRTGSLSDIRSVCLNHPSPFAATTLAAVAYLENASPPEVAVLREVVQSEGSRQSEKVQGPTRYLMDIASIAPMVGLLGTVLGMLTAFRAVAVDEAMARPMVLAEGVRKALYTTAEGLLVAIPCAAAYAYFREKAASLVSRLEAAAAETVNGLQTRRS